LTASSLFASIRGMRYTKKQFEAEYPDDDACLEAVFQNRFGDLKFCPHCGAETTFYRVKKRQCYACKWCGYQLHPLADTIFRKTTTPLKDWFYAVYLFSVSKNGVSAKELERHLGVTYKCAWRMAKQIRLLMQQDADMLSGTVEMDETYIGGRHRGKSGRGSDNKVPVFGMVERGGAVKATATADLSHKTVRPLIREAVDLHATVNTDYFHLYKLLIPDMGYSHEKVNHSKGEYVRGSAHTNTIEGFWGQMKRSIDGTYHCVSPKYLQTYVNEFVFRYNFRGVAVCPVLLELASKPV
jgi:transposase